MWECRLYARYLVGRDATPEVVQRYCRASETMFESESSGSLIVEFVRQNPWALPFLDAACGLLHSDDMLRKKLLLLMAILEATPTFVEYFLPKNVSIVSLFVGVVLNGCRAVFKIPVGLLLYRWAAARG